MIQEEILRVMPPKLRTILSQLSEKQWEKLREIRIRLLKPLLIHIEDEEYGINMQGICKIEESYCILDKDLEGLIKFITNFSIYALEDEIRQGYMTLEGGHRVGIVGKAVVEQGIIKTLKYISGVNIRIAHEVIGCSRSVLPYLVTTKKREMRSVYRTLIVSPPKCGKTTLLRDIVRSLSVGVNGYGPFTVGVVDERSEIAGCYLGRPQKDVGPRTDVLDACPKVEGMRMLLRSMAPQVIAVDEIGKKEDITALEEVLSAGIGMICTIHGESLEDCIKMPILNQLIHNRLFERIVVLSLRNGPCTVEDIVEVGEGMRSLR